MFCRSLFVLLYFFFWPLCCLFFFDIRILITTLETSNSSYTSSQICWFHPFERLNPVEGALIAIKESLQLTGTRQNSKDLERISDTISLLIGENKLFAHHRLPGKPYNMYICRTKWRKKYILSGWIINKTCLNWMIFQLI